MSAVRYDPNNVVLRDCGVVFMLVPKIAHTSIKTAILQGLGCRVGPSTVHQSPDLEYVTKEEAREFPCRVAFVRDPLNRLASLYRHAVFRPKWAERELGPFGLSPSMTFDQFVCRIAQIPDEDCVGNAGHHFRSQCHHLCDGDEIIPTFVGRFENLVQDWHKIQLLVEAAGGPSLPSLEHRNASMGPMPRYSDLSRDAAVARYRQDILTFGYV